MRFKYNHGGETHELALTTDRPSGKRFAVRHNDEIYYAPLVDTNSANASALRVTFGGGVYALASANQEYSPSTDFIFSEDGKSVTINSAFADFGVQVDNLPQGEEIYPSLESIFASQSNSTIFGNAQKNHVTLAGGDKNFIVGGIGSDNYYFNGGGGVIVGFGTNVIKNGQIVYGEDNATLAISLAADVTQAADSVHTAYNRNDPTSYMQGNDRLYVNGTVVEIAFSGHALNSSEKSSVFSAYVTYDADGNTATTDNTYTVLLSNIVKAPTKTGSAPRWKTDDVAAQTLKIYDTSSGTSKVLSYAALNALFETKANSDYTDNIAALDAFYESTPYYKNFVTLQGGNS